MTIQLNWLAGPVLGVLALVVGVTGVPMLVIMLYRKQVSPVLLAALVPAVAVGMFVRDPWFTVPKVWDYLRLLVLVSWLPALLLLEGRVSYQTAAAKWLTRYAVYAGMGVFMAWVWFRVESGVLIQAAVDIGGSHNWLVATDDGEDLFLYTRTAKFGPVSSQKIADSIGASGVLKCHLHPSTKSLELSCQQ